MPIADSTIVSTPSSRSLNLPAISAFTSESVAPGSKSALYSTSPSFIFKKFLFSMHIPATISTSFSISEGSAVSISSTTTACLEKILLLSPCRCVETGAPSRHSVSLNCSCTSHSSFSANVFETVGSLQDESLSFNSFSLS